MLAAARRGARAAAALLPPPALAPPARLASTAASRGVVYYARPVPSLSRDDVAGLVQSLARRTPAGARGSGHRLDPTEAAALGAARRGGVLVCGARARSRQLANAHLRFCWASARAYVAVDALGLTVTVDARPLAGLAKAAAPAAAGAARVARAVGALLPRALAAAQAAAPGLQVVNAATLAADAAAALPGPREGSNDGRTPDAAPGEVFTVVAPSRAAARDAAARVAAALAEEFGWRDAAGARAAREESAAARAARKRALLLRRLGALAADAHAVKNLRVPAGAIEGYVRAVAAGEVVGEAK